MNKKYRLTIQYVEAWEEYQVRVIGHPEMTHHTDDKQDAIMTKKDMEKRLNG